MGSIDRPIANPLLFFLPVALLGTVVLYEYHGNQLNAELRAKDKTIAGLEGQIHSLEQQVADAKTETAKVHAAEELLESDFAQVKARHQQEVDRLTDALDQAQATVEQLQAALEDQSGRHQQEIAAIQADHTKDLEAEAAKTAQAHADHQATKTEYQSLESRYDEAKETVLRLESNLASVEKAMAEAAAEHKAQIDELEQHLNERVRLARVTPKDADLVRAARMAGLLNADDPAKQALDQLQAEKENLQQDYAALQQSHRQTLAELEQARAEFAAQTASLQSEHADALAAQADDLAARHAVTLADARQQIETLQQHAGEGAPAEVVEDLRQALEKANARVAELQASASAAQAEARSRESEQAAALAAAEEQVQDLAEELASSEERLAELEDALAEARQRSESTVALAAAPEAATATEPGAMESGRGAQEPFVCQVEQLLDDLQAQPTQGGLLLAGLNRQLRFPPDSTTLDQSELSLLDRVVDLLQRFPDVNLSIEGHTDSIGSAEVNKTVSLARAQAVADALVARGIAAQRLSASGLGADRPIETNETPAGRLANRRVEVYLNLGGTALAGCLPGA